MPSCYSGATSAMSDESLPNGKGVNSTKSNAVGSKSGLETDGISLTIPVIEEQVHVQKRVVDQGGYRVSKKVSIRHETVDEPLQSCSVQVERHAVGRLLPSMEVPATRQEGNTLIISVVEEVLVTEKRLMLKEEIHITQTEATIHKPVHVALRSEEVLIEPLDPREPPDNTHF
jgi:stress response protein YsnF